MAKNKVIIIRPRDISTIKQLFAMILCVCFVGYLCNTVLNDMILNLNTETPFYSGSPQLKQRLSEKQLRDIQTNELAYRGRDIKAFGFKPGDIIGIPGVPDSIISPVNTTCDKTVDLLIYVQSSWSNYLKRRYIRSTWGGKNAHLKYNIKVIFVLGKPEHPEDQVKINNEKLLFGDILEINVTESFQSLSFKCLAALHWIANMCPDAKFVLKLDDDIFINPFIILGRILNMINHEVRLILCHVIEEGNSPIVRDKASKWYIPASIFPNRTVLPRFCTGYFAIMTKTVIKDLYLNSRTTPLITVDDVYLFGHLTQGIQDLYFVDVKRNLTFDQAEGLDSYKAGKDDFMGISVTDLSKMEELWSITLSRGYARVGLHTKVWRKLRG